MPSDGEKRNTARPARFGYSVINPCDQCYRITPTVWITLDGMRPKYHPALTVIGVGQFEGDMEPDGLSGVLEMQVFLCRDCLEDAASRIPEKRSR